MGENEDCPGCGATPAERRAHGGYSDLHECKRCTALKCCMCDMGDDVECINCDVDAEPEAES